MRHEKFLFTIIILLAIALISVTPLFANGSSESEESLSLQLWTSDETVAENTDAFFIKKIEDTFDVELAVELRGVGAQDYIDWLNLSITSGEIPDWMRDQAIKVDMLHDFAEQGIVAEIDPAMVEQNMPNYMAWTKKWSNVFGNDPLSLYALDGKYYSIPDAKVDLSKFCLMGFRGDWMESVGVKKIPETLQEVEDLLVKFTFEDPDGNGVNDTYGYIGIQDDPTWAFSPFYGSFGTYPGMFYVTPDGRVSRGEVEAGTKEALQWIRKWYEMGIIDPEWVVDGFEQSRNKVISNRVGSVWQNWLVLLTDGWYSPLLDLVPESYWEVSTGPEGPSGDKGIMNFNPLAGVGLTFGKHMEDQPEKMALYMRIFDTINFESNWVEAMYWGVEETTFTFDAEGNRVFTEEFATVEARGDYGFGGSYLFPSLDPFMYDPDIHDKFQFSKDILETRQETLKIIEGNFDILGPYPKPVWDQYATDLNDLTRKSLTAIITGEAPVSSFDDYVEQWMEMGGREVLQEAQTVYNLYYK